MRGRSHRLPSSEPPDDWGDGSWTVDCVCGVNFDDGEEMVNCDECGVWVHTRCSRFVKGETSFACDKCKNKINRNYNEETEVARLLVELPTKTMRMDNPFPSTVPPRPSFGLWTDRPIEERVHVHGIPGGDPALFQGLSSIFTPQLWSCTGYVPKKFNFQYREFPCWEEQNEIDAKPLKIETPLDSGVDALVSLSKEAVSVSPVDMLVGLRDSAEGAGCCERKPSPKETKKLEGKDSSVVRMQNSAKREKVHSRPIGGHLGKRKKEDMGVGKNQIIKKSKGSDREADSKKRAATPTNEAQKLKFNEDGGFKVVEADSHNIKNDVKSENILPYPESDGFHESCKVNLLAKTLHTEGSFKEVLKQACPVETLIKSEKLDNEVLCGTGCSPESGPFASSLVETKYIVCIPNKEEDFDTNNNEKHDLGDMNGGSSTVAVDSCELKHPVGDLRCAAPEVQDSRLLCNQNSSVSSSLAKLNFEKIGTASEQPKGDATLLVCSHGGINLDNTKHLNHPQVISAAAQPYENLHETNMVSCPSNEHKDDGVDCDAEAVDHCNRDDTVEGIIFGEPCQNDQGKGSTTALLAGKSSSDPKFEQRNAEESSKAGGINHGSLAPVGHGKVVLGVGKYSSTSSSQIISKLSSSGSCKPPARPASPNTLRSINSSKQRVKVNSYADIKKNNAVFDEIKDDARHETARRATKEQLKGYQSSRLKASQTSKASHASTPKRSLSDSKNQVLHPSSKPSAIHVVDSSGSGDTASSLLTQTVQHMQSKTASSGFSLKGERSSQLSSQQTSKANHSSSVHSAAPVNSSLTLSDEELALLLHQELNSSPRVPRVPRVRQAGSMPQLASAAATSMLIKRATGSGGKDQSSVSRRKSKDDLLKDGIRNSCEHTDATKKSERTLVTSDQQSKDPASDGSNRKETFNGSSEVSHLSQKNMCSTFTAIASSSSAEAIDQNISSLHNSTKDISDADDDDVSCRIAAPMTRTLPGLINEIMSSGSNMSCEELCDAVLPHWDNLRKVNGERYAYSSHSQAVLDCLRNRNEWAQLVDRGPKTNAGRKRRKLEADPPLIESEENDPEEDGTLHGLEGKNVESQQEEFPKGKRKARKRRRLALQGRGINDVRKRQGADALIEDDVGPFSHSSEEGTEGIFSEDEIQGTRKRTVGSESSSSSDEAGSL